MRSYRTLSISRGRNLRDLLSVALSLGSLQPAVSRHRHFVEPGLSSPWKLPATPRPPDPLASRPIHADPASVIPSWLGQQQSEQDGATFAVYDSVDQFWAKTALEGDHRRVRLGNVIAEPLQSEHEGAVTP